ncbi:MFS transporter [Mesorhizobium sp. M2D.F.Ca.ET.185.01.1.1]|uniref:MFS transporter n=1 Tax=unclassified Mesorhizobium TaxID=325217 RepID=UPI000FCB91B2|nr:MULTISPECIES: MFS transporter [unclassified Mesorhizobium]TGP75457.1 MFS transporter [bacterium M00.F.Ca.ET.227.01.1.1]TGP90335.1 MFS transporter [bacterium M00.F.Ca.ET.222.01.1.1]TGP96481.1 MFS transporter [bacterium M00.F.Ca.ET.221.01.1.1]TGT96924.1 MFS transporter [bacterium M00.F.Ca.ET.163.01.1.1]TGU24394.1 MFS transporter [bacterium M00.F.Ca.ET.156.01.1.1]TGU49691.1 MFS transporter [bacterium M00.F.Ca.ET.146.01.1.1]TGV66450.1 MFS transporter [Mesorhizobium sp. M2D.F.Ca.ET.160.01.1.1]
MSAIVTRNDCQPPEGGVAGNPARRAFGPSHRWKVLGIGVAANAGFSATFSGIPATAVMMRRGYHLDNASLGLALGLLGLGVALSELPWGVLTDRWGDRRVLLTGLGATAAWLFIMAMLVVPTKAVTPGVALLSASLLVAGLLGGSVNGSSGRAIMGWFGEGERGFAMSIRQTAVPLGGGLGALVLPSLALAVGFAAVFGLLAAVSAASAYFAWRWLHEPPVEHSAHVAAATSGPAPLRNIEVWRISSAIGLLCFPQVAVLTFASVFLHDFAGMGTFVISATLAAVQTGAMVMRVWSGRCTDRHGNRRPFLKVCSALSAFAFLVLWLLVIGAAGAPWLVPLLPLMVVIAGISVSAWHGVAYTELATLAGAGHVGTALSLANSFVFIGFCLVPIAIPWILLLFAWPGVWLAAAICAAVACPIFLRSA